MATAYGYPGYAYSRLDRVGLTVSVATMAWGCAGLRDNSRAAGLRARSERPNALVSAVRVPRRGQRTSGGGAQFSAQPRGIGSGIDYPETRFARRLVTKEGKACTLTVHSRRVSGFNPFALAQRIDPAAAARFAPWQERCAAEKTALLVLGGNRLSAFAYRHVMERRNASQSLRLDVGVPYHLAPLLGVVDNEFAKLGGRGYVGLQAQIHEPSLELRAGKRVVHEPIRIAIICGGVFAGAPIPCQPLAS